MSEKEMPDISPAALLRRLPPEVCHKIWNMVIDTQPMRLSLHSAEVITRQRGDNRPRNITHHIACHWFSAFLKLQRQRFAVLQVNREMRRDALRRYDIVPASDLYISFDTGKAEQYYANKWTSPEIFLAINWEVDMIYLDGPFTSRHVLVSRFFQPSIAEKIRNLGLSLYGWWFLVGKTPFDPIQVEDWVLSLFDIFPNIKRLSLAANGCLRDDSNDLKEFYYAPDRKVPGLLEDEFYFIPNPIEATVEHYRYGQSGEKHVFLPAREHTTSPAWWSLQERLLQLRATFVSELRNQAPELEVKEVLDPTSMTLVMDKLRAGIYQIINNRSGWD